MRWDKCLDLHRGNTVKGSRELTGKRVMGAHDSCHSALTLAGTLSAGGRQASFLKASSWKSPAQTETGLSTDSSLVTSDADLVWSQKEFTALRRCNLSATAAVNDLRWGFHKDAEIDRFR